jgi:hypothetical protein
MMLVLLQGTFTPFVHAHAGRTQGASGDNGRVGLALFGRCVYVALSRCCAVSPLHLSFIVIRRTAKF